MLFLRQVFRQVYLHMDYSIFVKHYYMSCFILMNYIQNIKKIYNIHSLKYLKIKKKSKSFISNS
jgi:hypothetical protein